MTKRYFVALLPALVLACSGCNVRQTEEGEAPDVDVQPGRLPEYDVDPPQVEIKTDTTEVIVPDVDIKTPRDTVR